MEWMHRARIDHPACDNLLDENHVPRLLQQHQEELRLQMNILIAMERRPDLEEEA
jgi:hypothetical protein